MDRKELNYLMTRKTKMYSTYFESLEDLQQRIVHECDLITPEMLITVRGHFQNVIFKILVMKVTSALGVDIWE